MIVFRHADPRLPFLWEGDSQPAARWHDAGEGPAHYFSDTPEGAWAEFLRHEEIGDAEDLVTIRRAIWAVEVPDEPVGRPALPDATVCGGPETHAACRREARRLRAQGLLRLEAPAAALVPGGANGYRVHGGLRPGPPRQGVTIVLYGPRQDLIGWRAAYEGRPAADLLGRVRRMR
jgi:hypothetical protein